MLQKQLYAPIIPNISDWPIAQLSKHRPAFLHQVINTSIQEILATHCEFDGLREMLMRTANMERMRIQKSAWRVDPPDDLAFWDNCMKLLNKQPSSNFTPILRKIVDRYVSEISGRFLITHYQLGQRVVQYALVRWLTPFNWQAIYNPYKTHAQLQQKIHITGAIEQLRELTRIGTVVMLPTHCSHLDSLLMAWVIDQLGLPHFVYGAGLNLFNNKLFAYFMQNLGTYTVDRRKKNLPYLNTLKTYATLALQWGCHSLFYPGGTRSRSGALEKQLKLGLLGATFEAQWRNYQAQGRAARKIFIVPIVLNYHCVLEAPRLIQSHLVAQGLSNISPSTVTATYRLFKLANNFLAGDSSLVVSIGQPMDLLGHTVNALGHSYNARGDYVDTYQAFLTIKKMTAEKRHKYEDHTKALGEAIVAAYYRYNYVLTSHLLAFVIFLLIKRQYPTLSLPHLLHLAPEKLIIPYTSLIDAFSQLRYGVLKLSREAKIQVAPIIKTASLTSIIEQGLHHLGCYYHERPLRQTPTGDIMVQNLAVILYYHNRLQGYALEQYLP